MQYQNSWTFAIKDPPSPPFYFSVLYFVMIATYDDGDFDFHIVVRGISE